MTFTLSPRILLLFIVVPLVEIYVLIQVGHLIGALPTIGLIILSALLGSALLRHEGMATLARIRSSMEQGRLPAAELVEGAVLLVSGVLLLTPGFITSSCGLVCMLPPLRRRLAQWIIDHQMQRFQGPPGGGPGGSSGDGGATIEGDFERRDR